MADAASGAASVAHFEIHAGDPARAQKFYETVFGWKFTKMEMGQMDYWLVATGRSTGQDGGQIGIDGGMLKRMGGEPEPMAPVTAFVCTMNVENIDSLTQTIKDNGGVMALEKQDVGGMGWTAYFKDPEGNIFGLFQNNPDFKPQG